MHVLPVGVRVLPAGFGAHLIYAACIVRIEKNTWRLVEHPIAVFIDVQVFAGELSGSYTEMMSNAVNIDIPENRTGRFTAVRAIQTVHLSKNLFMCGVKKFVCLLDLLKSGKEFLVGFPNTLCVIQGGLECLNHGDC
jgi:hypothetical protein